MRALSWEIFRNGSGNLWGIGGESVDNASLLKIVGGHLHFHPISREDAHAAHPHTTGKMTQELVIFCLRTHNAHAARGKVSSTIPMSSMTSLATEMHGGEGKGNFPLTKVQGIIGSNSSSRKRFSLFLSEKLKMC